MTTTVLGGRLERTMRERAARVAGRAAGAMEVNLRRNFQPHRKSGDTQAATSVRLESATPFTLTYVAKAETPQARYVNDGTRPHIITPKANPAAPATGGKWPRFVSGEPLLVFDWPKAGMYPARFRWVEHPGYRGSGWWDFTIAMWHDLLEQALASA